MNKLYFLLATLAVIVISGCTSVNHSYVRNTSTKPTQSQKKVTLSPDQYMVKAGDTLFSIAFANGIDYRTLALVNNIDPNKSIIHPGDILTVKIQGLNTSNVYRVRGGDTLYSIARKHGTTVKQLASINRIVPPYSINVGQLIVLDKSKKVFEPAKQSQEKQVAAAKPQISQQQTSSQKPQKEEIVSNTGKTYNKQSKLTWKWPTVGSIIKGFSKSAASSGINIAGKKGQNIVAAAGGKVVYAGNALRGYGNLIIIKHNDDYLSAYAHNDSILVKETQNVKAGQVIAKMGNTDSDRVNLHFEIRFRGDAVNPVQYLPKK